MLISINGLYGSGGNELGWALSEKLGWPVHDNELIRQAVADSGVDLRKATLAFYDEDGKHPEERPYGSAVLSLELDVLPIARDEETPKKENYQSGLLASFMDTTSVNNREGIPAVREKADIDSLREAQTAAVWALRRLSMSAFSRTAGMPSRLLTEVVSIKAASRPD